MLGSERQQSSAIVAILAGGGSLGSSRCGVVLDRTPLQCSLSTHNHRSLNMPPRNVYRPPGARQGHDENRGSTNRPSPNTTGGGHSRASIPGVDVGSRLKPPHSTPGLLKDGTINFEYILTPSRSSGLDKGGDV